MSENSSDSDSSCGWTVINHEGSDVEMVNSVTASDSSELTPGCSSLEQEEDVQVLQIEQGESSQNVTLLMEETLYPTFEETKSAVEAEEEQSPEDNVYFGTASDDSDIVTLEPPKLEEIGNQEVTIVKEAQSSEDFNMGSSSSSQYTFCQPETVFSSQPSDDESSSDETSNQPSPAFRRRRARKKTVSTSESEERLLIQKHQELVRKIHEDELNDMKDYLTQCQQKQEPFIDSKSWKENLARCETLTESEKISFDTQKKNLAAENQYLRISLEKEEKAISALQEELMKLREQIRILENKGRNTELVTENQKLNFLSQRETLLAETKMLKRELERERLIAMTLRVGLQQLSTSQSQDNVDSPNVLTEKKEIAVLQERLTELEQKLNFEQQRSDLWERLYVEAKDQNGKQETDGKKKGSRGNHRAKNKSKETFLGMVKETFDAMKNSTKEFVRHHEEKIKQAKEAVKENLKKFSDSVKSTFRHFKDTTKNIFDEKGNKRFSAPREETAEKSRRVFSDYLHPQYKAPIQNQNLRGPTLQRDGRKEKPTHFEEFRKNTNTQKCSAERDCRGNYFRKACSGMFECLWIYKSYFD
uniref:Cell cycle progression 1 n=1 Tax=Sciurus vulgaris TaxID=55149 RepID=A0A8D2CX54_SCIVU